MSERKETWREIMKRLSLNPNQPKEKRKGEKFYLYFNILATYAPIVAEDPELAIGFIRDCDVKHAVDLSSLESAIAINEVLLMRNNERR